MAEGSADVREGTTQGEQPASPGRFNPAHVLKWETSQQRPGASRPGKGGGRDADGRSREAGRGHRQGTRAAREAAEARRWCLPWRLQRARRHPASPRASVCDASLQSRTMKMCWAEPAGVWPRVWAARETDCGRVLSWSVGGSKVYAVRSSRSHPASQALLSRLHLEKPSRLPYPSWRCSKNTTRPAAHPNQVSQLRTLASQEQGACRFGV